MRNRAQSSEDKTHGSETLPPGKKLLLLSVDRAKTFSSFVENMMNNISLLISFDFLISTIFISFDLSLAMSSDHLKSAFWASFEIKFADLASH